MTVTEDDDFDDGNWIPVIKRRKVTKPPTPEEVLRNRVNDSLMPLEVKQEVLNKLENDKSDKTKIHEWVNNILKVPFGKYVSLPVSTKSKDANIQKFFGKVNGILDEAVYGMKSVKEEVLNYIAQFISTNNKSMPRILGLCGSPGIGKTAIIRKGFAKALRRPMVCMSMGGIRDSNYFLGHDYTYTGSRFGILVQNLIKLECMNGIMFMDEVDKISNSSDGQEIQNLLMHITDPVQNHSFHDKYFAGIDIDLSKIVFVFSFNDENQIDPILKDRIYIIRVPDPTVQEKIVIGKDYLMKELVTNIGLGVSDIEISKEIVEYIIKHYCSKQKGVRTLKKCLETIILKVNTARFLGNQHTSYKCFKRLQDGVKLPFKVTVEAVEELLVDQKEPEDKYISSMYI